MPDKNAVTFPVLNIKSTHNSNGTSSTELRFINNDGGDKILILMADESDQAVLIVGHSYIETLLAKLLCHRLINYRQEDAKRLSFDLKRRLCYSIGLLTDIENNDLKRINEMRNDFAHRFEKINFETLSVSAKCKEFEIFKTVNESQPISNLLPCRKKCEAEIAYLILSLSAKLGYIPKISMPPPIVIK